MVRRGEMAKLGRNSPEIASKFIYYPLNYTPYLLISLISFVLLTIAYKAILSYRK